MHVKIILSLIVLLTPPPAAQADRIISGSISAPFYDIYRPKTREEIYSSYFALVEKRNGISKLEARLIAQFEVVTREMDHGYQIAKPRVTEGDGRWTVRFPSSFSINDRIQKPDLTVLIDTNNGKVISLGKEKE
jgi:hypothetical protein